MDMLGQPGAGEGLSDAVIAEIGNLAQAFKQAERLLDSCVDAIADIDVASLDPLKGGTGLEGAFRHDRDSEPPTATGIMDVRSELAQCSPGSGGSRPAAGLPELKYAASNRIGRQTRLQATRFTLFRGKRAFSCR